MAIYRLFDEPVFPDPGEAEPDGLLAVGGDLSPLRLISAYSQGIFPWYGPESPILWWSPDPRPVLLPEALHVPRSLRRTLNSGRFSFTLDRDFAGVIRACAIQPRPGQNGTWLVPEMIEAYERLHHLGHAHSLEVRTRGPEGPLVGGLYGLALGRAFFGESMFHEVPEASKAALAMLMRLLGVRGYHFLDCQQATPHVLRMGATEVSRAEFLRRLAAAVRFPTEEGSWTDFEAQLA
ncbi:leucyl/phenylalanyl-tRNA--protein transferase [Desulfovibrio aminophilus]|nr:leucyl/phenylalanyl-tRNA--protein transferase [Desulfovibrio aminophilus]MCM0755828.1 leucyl/phenylalanyl-tRNA--protein transferase [Desulfovibrio aminophilus]